MGSRDLCRDLTELLRHGTEVAEAPGDWMPWNYRETLAGSDPGPAP
jgi:hypothetical protein